MKSKVESVAPDLGRGSSAPSAGHTPGPWIIRIGRTLAHIIGADGHGICTVALTPIAKDATRTEKDQWRERGHADARLIAAAPQMLEALKAARDHVWACWDNGDAEYADEIKADLDKIDAAIAKAKGPAPAGEPKPERPEGAFLPDPPSVEG